MGPLSRRPPPREGVGPEALSTFLRYAETVLPPAAFTERLSKLRKRARRGLLLSLDAT